MEFKYKQAYKIIETSLCLKIKEHEDVLIIFCALIAKCLKLNDEFTSLTASLNLNAK